MSYHVMNWMRLFQYGLEENFLKKLLDGVSLIKSYTILYDTWILLLNSSQRNAIKTMYLSQD